VPIPAPRPIGEIGHSMRWKTVLLRKNDIGGCAYEEPLQRLPRGRVGGDDLQGEPILDALVILLFAMPWGSCFPKAALPWVTITRTVALEPVAFSWPRVLSLTYPEVGLVPSTARLRARAPASLLAAG
jgi:hypothetical protein